MKDRNEIGAMVLIDQEKAFDRIEHNFIQKTLEKFGFGKNFRKWTEILYRNITAKVQVNGTVTEQFEIQRSVRQGCPLSMLLYVIAIEILSIKVRTNKEIKGIKIPNLKEEIKMLQHADDCTNFIKNPDSFKHLMKEYEQFGEASGSKINHEKTEILKIGNWRGNHPGLPPQYIKSKVKALGIFFGRNEEQENLRQLSEKTKKVLEIWAPAPLCFKERIQVAKTYMYSTMNYILKSTDITNKPLSKIDSGIIDFIWNYKTHYITKEDLYKAKEKGGMGLPNPLMIKTSNIINRFKSLNSEPNMPWESLYIYWFGFKLKNRQEIYRNNSLTKLIETPKRLNNIKEILIRYRENKELWEGENKKTYSKLREVVNKNNRCKIELENWGVNWSKTWLNLNKIKSLKKFSIIYKYIHGGWLTGDIAKRRRMIQNLPKCPLCKKYYYTKKHVILNCTKIKTEREGIVTLIKKYGDFKESNLLFLDMNMKTEDYLKTIDFTIDTINKCGQIISIRK
jgi:hypothetical protein